MEDQFQEYTNHFLLPGYSIAHQEKLARAKVAIIGAGGLGVPVLQYLISMGVGVVRVIDADKVQLKNLNRQVIYRAVDVGRYKVDVVAEVYKSDVQKNRIQLSKNFLNAWNVEHELTGCDVVVDATDNYETRYLLDEFCTDHSLPWVYAAVFRFEAQVSVFNYQGTDESTRYTHVYPKSEITDNFSCSSEGVIGPITGVVGSVQANEVFKIITAYAEPLAGKLLFINLENYQTRVLKINKSTNHRKPVRKPNNGDDFEISLDDLQNFPASEKIIIDIRSSYEYQKSHIDGAIQLDAAKVHQLIKYRKPNHLFVIYCEKGVRSRTLVNQIRKSYQFEDVYFLESGIASS